MSTGRLSASRMVLCSRRERRQSCIFAMEMFQMLMMCTTETGQVSMALMCSLPTLQLTGVHNLSTQLFLFSWRCSGPSTQSTVATGPLRILSSDTTIKMCHLLSSLRMQMALTARLASLKLRFWTQYSTQVSSSTTSSGYSMLQMTSKRLHGSIETASSLEISTWDSSTEVWLVLDWS